MSGVFGLSEDLPLLPMPLRRPVGRAVVALCDAAAARCFEVRVP